MRLASLVLALLVLLAAPSAQAGLVKKYDFVVSVGALGFGGNESAENATLGLFTGAFAGRGESEGLYGFVAASQGVVGNTTRIDVINTQDVPDQSEIIQKFQRGECSGDDCLAERSFTNATITLTPGSSFLIYADGTAVNHTEAAGFGLVSLIQPPSDFGGGSIGNLSLDRSLLVVGERVNINGTLVESDDSTFGMMPDATSSLTVSNGGASETFSGKHYLFRILGRPSFEVDAKGLLMPFVGNTEAVLVPSSAGVLREEFAPEAINEVLAGFGSNQTVVPPEQADTFEQLAPVLNGVFFGGAIGSTINNQVTQAFDFGLIRYARVTLTPSTDGAVAQGRSDFLLLGASGFYTTQKGADFGILQVPSLTFVLWLVAAGAIVAGFVLKPAVAGPQLGGFGLIRIIGLVFHGVAFILSFLLWDNEIRSFLGTSLLTVIMEGAFEQGAALFVTALFELLPYLSALFMFGMPIRFIVNSGLKIGGLQKARGIGKGIGNLAVWGLGTPFIPFFLNGIISPIVEMLGKAAP